MELARIDMAIEEFEVNYVILKEKKCIEQIEALDDYLRDIKKYRRKLANEKKKL